MGVLPYYLSESNLNSSYYGIIKKKGTISSGDFIEKLKMYHPEVDDSISELHLKAIFSTMNHLLSEGYNINFTDYLKVSTIIKGGFKSVDEYFNSKSHSIAVNFRPSQSFLTELRKKINLERVERPVKAPDIAMIRDCSGDKNCLRLEEANRIAGSHLMTKECTLAGIELVDRGNVDDKVLITRKELIICSHSEREIIFTFRHSFTPPAWLVKGRAISVKLRYAEERDGIYRESMPADSVWGG